MKLKIITGLIIFLMILGVVVFLIFYFFEPRQPLPRHSIRSINELDHYFQAITARQTPPALSVAVYKKGRLVYRKAFGYADFPGRIKADPATIFRWWSVTKLFTAAAIMQLAEEQKINLDDPVEKHLPYFKVYSKKGVQKTVTIRQLLSHQAGLKTMIPQILHWIHLPGQDSPGVTDFFKQKIVNDFKILKFEPGTRTKYTNTAYIVLGVIIEKVTDQKYEQYISDKILQPLQMNNASFFSRQTLNQRIARPSNPMVNLNTLLIFFLGKKDFFKHYVAETVNGRHWYRHFYTDYTPSTGLSGSAEEMARFGQIFLNKGFHEARKILSEQSIGLMMSEFKPDQLKDSIMNKHMGVGFKAWKINRSVVYGHAGGGPGFGSVLAVIPEKELVFAVVSNDTNIKRDVILQALDAIDW